MSILRTVTKYYGSSLVAQLVKNPSAMREAWVRSLGWEDPLEKETATHSSILAWRIPWTIHGVAKSWTRLSTHTSSFICLCIPNKQVNSCLNECVSKVGMKVKMIDNHCECHLFAKNTDILRHIN